jgi:iron only hydrogenase large subunit-like protein
MRIINFSPANCKNCYKCLRICPVKAIKFSGHQAEIDETRCIACGQCFVVCPQNARNIKSDLDYVQQAIKENKKVVVSLAPSFAGFFKNPGGFISALRILGFSSIEETAIGAEYVTQAYKSYIENNNKTSFITSCCPTINLLVERYYPELLSHLLPYLSPMLVHGKLIKEMYPESYTVFVGPCISKKCEALNQYYESTIDAVLTLEEIGHWLGEAGVDPEKLPSSKSDVVVNRNGRQYPIPGGIARGLEDILKEKDYDILSIHGLLNSKSIFEEMKQDQLRQVFLEISACNESCLGGPAIPKESYGLYTRKQNIKQYIDSLNDPSTSRNLNQTQALNIDIKRHFYNQKIKHSNISKEEVQMILRKMGKYEEKDELNCGACGYNTCIEKAVAIYEGMSQLDMCMPYMRTKAESMSDVIFLNTPNAIFTLDDQLKIIDYNPSAKSYFHIADSHLKGQPIDLLIKSDDFQEVLRTKKDIINKKVHFSQYGMVAILNILYLEKDHLILTIIINITNEEKRKREIAEMRQNTLDIAQNVIDKQMRVAQEIASLLGETTAETKVALTKLKHVVLGEEGDI